MYELTKRTSCIRTFGANRLQWFRAMSHLYGTIMSDLSGGPGPQPVVIVAAAYLTCSCRIRICWGQSENSEKSTQGKEGTREERMLTKRRILGSPASGAVLHTRRIKM